MKIFEKNECILSYCADPNYFEKHTIVNCRCHEGILWYTSEADTYTFLNTLLFIAGNKETEEMFIEHKSRIKYIIAIEDDEEDTFQVLNVIKVQHEAMISFIKKNSFSHFSKLNLSMMEYKINDDKIAKMRDKIQSLKNMKRFEDKSDIEKMIDKSMENKFIKLSLK